MKKYSLNKHQKDLVSFFNKTPYMGTLLWHEMGLGKTLTALHCAKYYRKALVEKTGATKIRTLILCPKSIIIVWKRELEKWMPDFERYVDVESYSQLHNIHKSIRYVDYRFVILDESHNLRNLGTQRIKNFQKCLVSLQHTGFKHGRFMLLSGTPQVNSGLDWFVPYSLCIATSPAEAVAYLTNKKRIKAWKFNFTQVHKTMWGLKFKGINGKEKLTSMLKHMTHQRESKECIDLPDKQVITIDLKLSDDKLLNDVDISVPSSYISELEALGRAKTPYLIDYVKDVLEGKEQLVVFSMFKGPLYALQEAVEGVELVTGDLNLKEKQAVIDRFREGKTRVLAMTYATGSEGLNLQFCRHAVYHSYPWTYASFEQAQARIHRLGQRQKTTHHIIVSGANDKHIFQTVMSKKKSVEIVKEKI